MEIRRLKCFIAVAECLHFGRAAQRLNIVQSAVSQQIKLLEQELGVELLKRSRHRVDLTEAGNVFMAEAKRALNQTEEAIRVARDAAAGKLGRLRLGFIDNALWSVLPPILRAFRDRFPGIDVSLQQLDRAHQIKALEDRELDVGVLPSPKPGKGFESELLVGAPLIVALPETHPLGRQKNVPLRLLTNDPFVAFPATMNTRLLAMTISICASAGFLPNVTQEAQQISTLLALVSAGLGVTLVPRWVAATHPPGIVYREIAPAVPRYELLIAWRDGSANSAIDNFRSVASQVIKTMDFGQEVDKLP
jgi:DNA-binding transcriptional LysR family regulator